MASETVDPIDWSHLPPLWAVPSERLVHSINRCSSATAGIRSCNLQHARQPPWPLRVCQYPVTQGLLYAATRGMSIPCHSGVVMLCQ